LGGSGVPQPPRIANQTRRRDRQDESDCEIKGQIHPTYTQVESFIGGD
jgi:hypothetical protein